MEDDLGWKTTLDGGKPWMEDHLGWKTTLDGRRPLMEDDLGWKTTFNGWRPLMEDDLRKKTTIDGRRPQMEKENHCMLPSPLCGTFSWGSRISEIKSFFGPEITERKSKISVESVDQQTNLPKS